MYVGPSGSLILIYFFYFKYHILIKSKTNSHLPDQTPYLGIECFRPQCPAVQSLFCFWVQTLDLETRMHIYHPHHLTHPIVVTRTKQQE